MAYNNNYNQGGAGGAGAPKQKKEVINKGEWVGFVRTRSGKPGDPIKFIPWANGGVIHITLEVQENIGADENGQAKIQKGFFPVNLSTKYKPITVQQLQSIQPGMKVRIVGKLINESYTSKKDGERRTSIAIEAFLVEVLEMPQQTYGTQWGAWPQQGGFGPQQGYPQQGFQHPQGYQQPQGGYPQQGAWPQQGGFGPQQGYPQQGFQQPQGYQQPQGGYPQQGPWPQQGGYAPQQGYQQPQGGAQPQGQPQGGTRQPYYQRPGASPQGPANPGPAAPATPVDDDDMPPSDGMPVHDINV